MRIRAELKYNVLGAVGTALLVTLLSACGQSGGSGSSHASTPAHVPPPSPGAQTNGTSNDQNQNNGNWNGDGNNPQAHDQAQVTPLPVDDGEPDQTPDPVAQSHPHKPPPIIKYNGSHDQGDRDQWNQDTPNDDSANFDAVVGLKGMGLWITIGNQRFFKPHFVHAAEERDWQPYQHGYWSYDTDFGWTWVSYDQWGSVTDHYGVWRHHKKHGWIWLAFADRRYRPHCVSWFDDGDYVGWYPYFNEYSAGYQRGYADGFDDGYWEGYQAASKVNQSGFSFNLGFTVVNRADVTVANVYTRRVRRQEDIYRVAARGCSDERIRMHHVGYWPGGTRESAFGFIQGNASVQAFVGRSTFEDLGEGNRMMRPPRDQDRDLPPDEKVRWQLSVDLSPAVLDIWFRGAKANAEKPDDVPVKPIDKPRYKAKEKPNVKPVAEPAVKPAVLDPEPVSVKPPAPVVADKQPVKPVDVPTAGDKCSNGKPKHGGKCRGKKPEQVVPVSADTIVPAVDNGGNGKRSGRATN